MFAAVIAHADEPDMLRRCIEHHLAIGIERIFVSLNLDDPESARVAAHYAQRGVRAEPLAAIATDEFDYFTAAKDALERWVDADWLAFLDSDEFWVPATGRIADVAALDASDAYEVLRYNVPTLRAPDGTVSAPIDGEPATWLAVAARVAMSRDYLDQNADAAWISANIAPKIMIRPGIARSITPGAHNFTPRDAATRVTRPDDLVIVHVPFTTEARFRQKVASIRAMLARVGHRYRPGEAWHWRRWVDVDDAGALGAEFAAQAIDAALVPSMLAAGALTTPARLLARPSAAR